MPNLHRPDPALTALRSRLDQLRTRPSVDVHFDGHDWLVTHRSLPRPLAFTHLDDAELRAGELGHATGDDVTVHAQDGALLARFPIRA